MDKRKVAFELELGRVILECEISNGVAELLAFLFVWDAITQLAAVLSDDINGAHFVPA